MLQTVMTQTVMTKILVCQPIFCPDQIRFERNVRSLTSLAQYIQQYPYPISFAFGGYSKDEFWESISQLIRDSFGVEPVRFPKNLGKASVVNSLLSNIDTPYILTCDSDICFPLDEPRIFERLIGLVETQPHIGLLALMQREANCHDPSIYAHSEEVSGERLVWPSYPSGIAGGALFISTEAWRRTGYRVMGVYAGDDAYLLIDIHNLGYSIRVIDSLSIIHPPDNDMVYAEWKKIVCHRDQSLLSSEDLEIRVQEADTFWNQPS